MKTISFFAQVLAMSGIIFVFGIGIIALFDLVDNPNDM